jgi:hypothetical protein
MLTESNNSISELVYLFVDGESSSFQNEMLFKALANSNELQQELQEAILLRTTLEQDSAELAVPLKTTTTIFQNAGINLPSNMLDSGVASFGQKILIASKSIALPLFTAFVGAVATFTFFTFFQADKSNSNFYSGKFDNSNQIIASDKKPENSGVNSKAISNSNPKAEQSTKSDLRQKQQNNKLLFAQKSNLNSTQQIEKEILPDNQEIIPEINQITNSNSTNLTISDSQISKIEKSNYYENIPLTNSNKTNTSLDFAKLDNNFTNIAISQKLPISFAMRGMMDIASFPNNTKSDVNQTTSNITLSIAYQISDDIKIGIEGGRQSLRYYTFENGKNEKATQRESIDWAGAFINKTFNEFTFSNISPFANGTLGATVSGPTGRLLAGMKWQPENSISLSAGVEASTFFYQKSSNWGNISALGFVYQVEINY